MDVEAVDAGQDARTNAGGQDGGGQRFHGVGSVLDRGREITPAAFLAQIRSDAFAIALTGRTAIDFAHA